MGDCGGGGVGLPTARLPVLPAAGRRLQDHALLPVFYLNATNMLAVCLNALLWVYNIVVYVKSLQMSYIPFSGKIPLVCGCHMINILQRLCLGSPQ